MTWIPAFHFAKGSAQAPLCRASPQELQTRLKAVQQGMMDSGSTITVYRAARSRDESEKARTSGGSSSKLKKVLGS